MSDFNYIISDITGFELLEVDHQGIVVAADGSGIGHKFIGLRIGAVKAILKRRFTPPRGLLLLEIAMHGGWRKWKKAR